MNWNAENGYQIRRTVAGGRVSNPPIGTCGGKGVAIGVFAGLGAVESARAADACCIAATPFWTSVRTPCTASWPASAVSMPHFDPASSKLATAFWRAAVTS